MHQVSLGSDLVCGTQLSTPRRLQLSVNTGPIALPPSGKWQRRMKSASAPSTLDPSVANQDGEDALWGSGPGVPAGKWKPVVPGLATPLGLSL